MPTVRERLEAEKKAGKSQPAPARTIRGKIADANAKQSLKAAGLAKLSRIKDDPNTPQPKAPRKPTIVEELKRGIAPKAKQPLPVPQVKPSNPISKLMAQEKVNLKHAQEYDDRQTKAKATKEAAAKAAKAKWDNEHGRNTPVLGPVLRGMDAVSKFIKPATDVAETLYTPGASLSVVNAATKGAGNLISKVAPKLVNSAAGRVAKTAATEAAVGVPLAVGNKLARDPNASGKELAKEAAFGAVGGGIIGGVGRLGKEVISKGVKTVRQTLAEAAGKQMEAVDTVARQDLPQTVRRTTSKDSVPELFPERVRRTVGPAESTPIVRAAELPVEPPKTVRARIEAEQAPQAAMTVRARQEAQQAEGQVAATTVRARLEAQPMATPDVSPAPVTQRTPGQRGFVSTLEQSGKLNNDVSQGLRQSPDRNYEQITNEDTVARANQRVTQNVDAAEAYVLGGRQSDAEQLATGMRLIQQLQSSGQTERAVTIAENLSKKLTDAGQTVQAASIWNRLSPEGALMAAQRKVNRVNENLLKGQEPSKISPQQAQDITDAATVIQNSGASKERAGTVMEIMERVRKGEDIATDERQLVADFVADAKRFLKPADSRPPRPARAPREMSDKRVRDRVTSFLEAQEQAAKERLRSKGVQISSNPIDIWADYAYIGALKLAKGTVKFADWSDHMVRELGENVRPMLRQVYEKAQDVLGQSAKKINEQTISKAERVAEGYVKSNQAMSAEDVTVIRNLAQKVSGLSGKNQQIAAQELQAVLNGFEKVGVGRKMSAALYIFMLLTPRTQVRNIVGNELMYRLERLSRFISTPIDIAASKVTGGPRTITFKRGPSVWDDFFKTTTDYVTGLKEGAVAGARGVNPEGLSSKYEIGGLAFRSKYNPLTYMEKALGGVMKGFDFAAYQRAVNQRMSEMAYLDALNSGVKGDDNIRAHMQTFMTNMDDAVHDVAKKYGQYATLQDDTVLSRKITGFRRGLNQVTAGNPDFGLGSLVVPFAKTPANLLLRGLDYSPAGIIKAVWQANKVLRSQPGKTDLTRADVITSVSRALMGSGLGATAYWLADKGVMFGQSNKDKEVRNLQQQAGIRDFQVNGSAFARMLEAMATGGDIDAAAKIQEGDTLWSYEWAQPTSMPMAIGSNIYQGVKDKQSGWKTAGEAAVSGFGTLFNSSVLSGIREAFQIPPGEDNAVKAIGMNLVKQAPGMFTPSIVRNINSYMDGRIKETYTPDDMGAITSYAASSIPGLSQKMPQKVNTFGQPQTRPNSFIDVFVSPADRNKYQPTKEAQFVIDLLQESGDTRVAPRAVAKYLTGKDVTTNLSRKVDLTPEQYVKLQTIVGQESARLISLINPELPTDKKVELVVKALDSAGKLGRNELKKEVGIKATK